MGSLVRARAVGGALAVMLAGTGVARADYALTILHINDLHSRIEPINKYDSTCSAEDDAEGKCFGGVARIKTVLDERRAALDNRNVVTLDAGDQFQGSLFYTSYKGAAAAEFMNAIGFDAMAVGNHEFDDGPEKLAAFIAAVDVPVLSGNITSENEPVLGGRIPGVLIKRIGGERVAFVSVVAEDTAETSSPGPNIEFLDAADYLRGAVRALEGAGIDKIVAVTHVGLPRDIELARAVPGIDVIVGGHSHTYLSSTDDKAAGPYPTVVYNAEGDMVPIVQAYAYGKYVGEVEVVWDDAGDVISAEGAPIVIDGSVAADADIAARVAELAAPLEEIRQQVIGESAAVIEGSRESCRAGECQMGVLAADAMLARSRDQGIDMVITNGGGLRASIDAGSVTMGEVLTVLPFQNTLATFQIGGAHILAALENGVGQVEDGAGRFPQVAGLRFEWTRANPPGERVLSAEVQTEDGWAPLDPEATYGVASNNYMRGGGDGYSMFRDHAQNVYDYGPNLEVVVADYIAGNTPYEPTLAGRITERE